MKRTSLAVLFVAALSAAPGCAKKEKEPLVPYIYTPPVEPTTLREEISVRRLAGLPPHIRDTFLLNHPGAGITSVNVLFASTGEPVYEIDFLDKDNNPREVRYTWEAKIIHASVRHPAP